MGIQILPSTGDAIAGTIKDIASGIDKFINPNKDLQLAVQRTVATNPELLQHMADLEANAPGTMGRLGLGNLAPIIAAVPQSAAAIGEQAIRPGMARQATAQQQATTSTAELTTSKAQLTGDIVKKAGNIMAQDPSISFDAALRTLTGETKSERTVADAKAKVAPVEADAALAAAIRARKLPENLDEIDWTTEARDFLNGDLAGGAATAYFGNKDTRDAFTHAIQGILTQRQIDATSAWRASRGGNTTDNLEKRQAFAMYQRTGGTANLDAWRSYLFDPNARQKAEELLVSGAKPKDASEKALLDIATINKEQKLTTASTKIIKINSAIKTNLDAIEKADSPDNREQLINSLNISLQQRAQLGGMDVKAEWKDEAWYNLFSGGDRLIFKDRKTGKVIDPDTINAVISDPNARDIQGPPMSDLGRQSLQAILALPESARGAALNKMRMQLKSKPEAVREVEQALQGITESTKTGFQPAPIDSSSADFGGE